MNYMKEKLKEYIDLIDDKDVIFLRRMYTIFRNHMREKGIDPDLTIKNKNISRCDQYCQNSIKALRTIRDEEMLRRLYIIISDCAYEKAI